MSTTAPLQILKASAGSGKTFALTVHFIRRLLQSEYSYKEVLALTFTNKATAEMKDRVLTVLEALAKGVDDRSTNDYRHEILKDGSGLTPAEIQLRADKAYRRILHDYSHFSVSTIDGFSQKVIRSFAYELDLDGLYRIELNIAKVRQDLLKRLYTHLNNSKQLFDWLVERILQNIDLDKSWNIDRELYDLSNVIFSEDFQQLDQIIDGMDENSLFSKLAAANRKSLNAFKAKYKQYVTRIVDIYESSGISTDDLLGKSRNFLPKFAAASESYNDTKDYLTLKENIGKLKGNIDAYQSEKKRLPVVDALFQQLDPRIREFDEFLGAETPNFFLAQAVDANLYYLRLLKQMSTLLAAWRSDNNAQLISDAQLLLKKIGLTEHGDPTFVWEKIGNRYKYFLFDEFQDTSNNQWQNLLPLLANALSTSGRNASEHLIVGDVKQSIYRWRNGDWRILLEGVEKDIKRIFNLPNAKGLISEENLDTNYRSEKNIIEFNNYVFSTLPTALQEMLNTHIAGELEATDYERIWTASGFDDAIIRAYDGASQLIPPHKQHYNGGNIQVELLSATDPDDDSKTLRTGELRQLACEKVYSQLVHWLQSGDYKPQDIGILVRTHNDTKLLIEYFDLMARNGGMAIPFISGDALLLSNNIAIKALIESLYFIRQEDKLHSIHLGNLVFYFAEWQGRSLAPDQWLAIKSARIEYFKGLLPDELISRWQRLRQLPLVELVEQLIAGFGFTRDSTLTPALLAFRDIVSHYAIQGDTGLPNFLEYWEDEKGRLTLPSQQKASAVEIITIHKSKGLAFNVVVIPFCDWTLDGINGSQVWFDVTETAYADLEKIPLKYDRRTKASTVYAQYHEETLYNFMDAVNYLYVAMTRAKKHLHVIAQAIKANKKGEEGTIRQIGHVLQTILETHPQHAVDQGSLYIDIQGEPDPKDGGNDPEAGPRSAGIRINHYKTSDELRNILDRQTAEDAALIRLKAKSAAFGNVVHELMSMVTDPSQVENAVSEYVDEGHINPTDRDLTIQYLQSAWEHPELGQLLRGAYIQLDERSIIDKSGKTVRPDKILHNDTETIVIDFKSTSKIDLAQHYQQVKTYQQYLQELGYPNVRGYLYYFEQQVLEAVV